MKNMPLLIGTIVVSLIMIVGVAFMFSGDSTPTADQLVPLDEVILVPENPHVKGAPEAAITVVEFSDFQCPACSAAQPLVNELLAQYGDSVRFIYRHYPLISIHKNAQAASIFAQAATEQDKFWEVHDMLFQTQPEWSTITNDDDLQAKFMTYAEALQLDTALLEEKMKDTSVLEAIQRDVTDGNTAKIAGTPTFYVNGVLTPAPQLLSTVEKLVVTTPETDVLDSGK
ncbi:MAG: thioredoxin domain-containing protein [Candidatus Pacebacteria bacterium]|nr:thioredoxin domain-containing protein [Candidatus Paceibacterota bacterium]PIR63636.1 MAG: hypothetical protein COU64_03505 [Candidatus Pacebacteria bacterium CG10_big_fil_rev_8_21_14_0_10_40_26]PIZ78738.1 MAG: hypothetical protein COY01_03875 [Candidatus Pacebacteria bacterium CG_4_10_14_0_2_um_filter_40_20]PJA68410.1 MAG: hypothetical protein CO156_05440 [Candidatus Pacebacteria bacterium CG_4_9_14_3_um_filter_40_12]PJC41272.1 MAG: hypothetical protein CO041_05510 [Candidatus Pacebacteria 